MTKEEREHLKQERAYWRNFDVWSHTDDYALDMRLMRKYCVGMGWVEIKPLKPSTVATINGRYVLSHLDKEQFTRDLTIVCYVLCAMHNIRTLDFATVYYNDVALWRNINRRRLLDEKRIRNI